MQSDKQRAINAAVVAVDKAIGVVGIVRPMDSKPDPVPAISTGSIGLDFALGVGGLPRGRVAEMTGPHVDLQRALAFRMVVACQRAGGVVAYIDSANEFDAVQAKRAGVDLGSLLVSQPDCAEQAMEVCDQLCRTGAVDLILVDHVGAMRPRVEIEDGHPDTTGIAARCFSTALRKITAVAAKQNTAVVFLNQPRGRVGAVFSPEAYPEVGSNALKFYSSVRLDVRRVDAGEQPALNVRVLKNKVAPPFREATIPLLPDGRPWSTREIAIFAVARGLPDTASEEEVRAALFA